MQVCSQSSPKNDREKSENLHTQALLVKKTPFKEFLNETVWFCVEPFYHEELVHVFSLLKNNEKKFAKEAKYIAAKSKGQ